MDLETCIKTFHSTEDALLKRKLSEGLDVIRCVSDKNDYLLVLETYTKLNSKNIHLDDFMPRKLQEDYLSRGLESIAKVMKNDVFEKLYKNIILINQIGDNNYEM